MPVEFLSDEQAAAYGWLPESLSRAELERFFFLDDVDRGLVEAKRRDHNKLGFALQLVTVRNAGRSLRSRWWCRRSWWTISPSSLVSRMPRV